MDAVKRYDCDLVYIGTGEYVPDMTESPDGGWVEYDDVPKWNANLEECPCERMVLLIEASGETYLGRKLLTWDDEGHRFETGDSWDVEPTHWMPLPEPPP